MHRIATKYSVWLTLVALTAACGQSLDPDAELTAAQERYSVGDYRTAAIRVSNVLQQDGRNAEARALRGRILLASDDAGGARQEFDQALRLGASVDALALEIAQAAIRLGDGAGALATLDGSAAAWESQPLYWTLRGEALMLTERVDEAAAAYATSAELGPESSRNLVGRARLALYRDDSQQAEALFEEAVRRGPEDPDVRWSRAAALLDLGRVTEAVDDLEASIALYEAQPVTGREALARAMLVQARLALGDGAGARDAATALAERAPNAALTLYARGMIAYQGGELDRAVTLVQQAVNQQPDNPRFRTLLGGIQIALGRIGQAEQNLAAALASAPRDPAATRLLGELRLRQQRPDAALEVLQPLAATGTNSQVSLLAAAASLAANDPQAAIDALERTLEEHPDDDAVRLELARAYLAAGRSDDAARFIDSAFADKTTVSALRGELMLLADEMRAGNEQSGRRRAAAIEESFAEHSEALIAVATYYRMIEDTGEAIRVAARAVGVDRQAEPAWMMLMRLRFEADGAQAARDTLQEAVTAVPASLPLRAALAALELELGATDRAIRIGRALQQDYPSEAAGSLIVGEAAIAQRRYDDAVASLAQAFELQPAWPIQWRQVLVLQLAGRPDEANARLKEWVDEHPDHAESVLAYALALQGEGRSSEALDHYERVLDDLSQNFIALNNAAWLRYELNRGDALELAEKAYALAPDNAAVLDTLGWILVEQNREVEGIPHLERAAELAPQALEVRYHLAQSLARAGRVSDARRELEAVLSAPEPFASRDAAQALLESL